MADHPTKIKELRCDGRKGAIAAMLVFCLLGLSGCGKKPPQVEAPEGAFAPHVYPNPATDAQP